MTLNQLFIDQLPTAPGSAMPRLELIYGTCMGLVRQDKEWTVFEIDDDHGRMQIFYPSRLANVSSTLAGQCLLLANVSGKSYFGQDPASGRPYAVAAEEGDLVFHDAAYERWRVLTGKTVNQEAVAAAVGTAEAATEQTAQVIETKALETVAVQAVRHSEKVLPASFPETETSASVLDAIGDPVARMDAKVYLECLESAYLVCLAFTIKHPEVRDFCGFENIRQIGTSLKIQRDRKS